MLYSATDNQLVTLGNTDDVLTERKENNLELNQIYSWGREVMFQLASNHLIHGSSSWLKRGKEGGVVLVGTLSYHLKPLELLVVNKEIMRTLKMISHFSQIVNLPLPGLFHSVLLLV